MNLLTDVEKSNVIFKAINSYKPGENDLFIIIAVLVIEKIQQKHMQLNNFSPDDIYDEIEDCFSFFNSFIRERNIDLPKITLEQCEATKQLINQGINELYGDING